MLRPVSAGKAVRAAKPRFFVKMFVAKLLLFVSISCYRLTDEEGKGGAMALSPWFVTGFVEGDGSFTFSRTGSGVNPVFAIKLYAGDRPLLEQIREYFGGIGQIYSVKPRRSVGPKSGDTKAAAYFRVSRKYHLMKVVDHFERYPLQGLKAEGFRVWKDMVLLKVQYDRCRRFDLLNQLAVKLSSLSPRNLPSDASHGGAKSVGASPGGPVARRGSLDEAPARSSRSSKLFE